MPDPQERIGEIAAVARWHVQTAPDRLSKWGLAHLPHRTRRRLVQTLEWVGRPQTITLGSPDPRQADILGSRHQVAEGVLVTIAPRPPFDTESGNYWPPRFVSELADVVVDPTSGLVFRGGHVIEQSSSGFRPAADGAFLSGALARVAAADPPLPVPGPVVPMGTIWNYAMFLVDTLPRLLRVREQCPDATPVFGRPVPAFVASVLSALDIPFHRSDAPALRPDAVWLCDPAPYSWPHPQDLAGLRDIARTLAGDAASGPDRIVITREGGRRSLLDEDRYLDRLRERGYSVVALSSMPWREQIACFRHARSVVGDHGAGLANLAFMDPGAQLIEVTAGSWWTPTFQRMAGIQQVRYDLVTIPAYDHAPHGTADDAWERVEPLLDPAG
jgi:hypothetical protein